MQHTRQRDIWFVTGCSTGIGRGLAVELIAAGRKVAVTARNIDAIADIVAAAPDRAIALPLDIADPAAAISAVDAATQHFGRIDVLVNNAGVGLAGAIEEAAREDIEMIFRTNVFGTLDVIRAVLPQMRARRDGHIITVTSVGGMRGSRGVGIYNGTKFAMEGIHEALREELAPLNIDITVLEPGVTRTDFRLRTMVHSPRVIDDYATTSGVRRKGLMGYGPEAATPEMVAKTIIAMMECGRKPPMRLALGADCVNAVRGKLVYALAELQTWEPYSLAPATGKLPDPD